MGHILDWAMLNPEIHHVPMRPHREIFNRSPVLSVQSVATNEPFVLVITDSSIMARAVGDFVRQLQKDLKPVWVTSVDTACRQLQWKKPRMVIIDAPERTASEAVNAIHEVAPDVELLFLGGQRE